MSSAFKITEHVIPGQHIREYSRSTKKKQEVILRVAVKHYVPNATPIPVPENAITVIVAHGTGAPKEVFEPFCEDLCHQLRKRGLHVRGIWMLDCSNQGASGVLNETIQGDDTGWFDHSRDMLQMVNHFRDQMPRPIIGFAHSMGCAQLVHLSIMHPRLLSALTLCEPIMFSAQKDRLNPAMPSAMRRDYWESREKASTSLSRGLASWDPRVRDRYLKYALRSVPTPLYDPERDPNVSNNGVTLTTTKYQEAWSYLQTNLDPKNIELDHLVRPDQTEAQLSSLFARPECYIAMRELPSLRPDVLWVFGGQSVVSPADEHEEKLRTTGTEAGGSGGVVAGRAAMVVYEDVGHLIPFEHTMKLAETSAEWLERWFAQWLKDEKIIRDYDYRRSDENMVRASKEWLAALSMPLSSPRPTREKL